MRKDDPTARPSWAPKGGADYERRWAVATSQLLSYVPFEVVKELREIAEGWVQQRAVELAGNGIGLLAEMERKAVIGAYARHGSGVAAAKELGIGTTTMYRKLKQYGVCCDR